MSNIKAHKFIVLEGISGSGKTELGKLLAQQISGQYYTTPPEAFRSSRKEVDEKVTLESRFWFYLASVVQASDEISKILKMQSVVCDKYILSTVCYHKAMGVDIQIPQWVKFIEPDHTFLVYCDNHTRLKRLRASRGPITNKEKYESRQQMEQRCLAELRKCICQEIDNTPDGPQNAINQILATIRR
jgi:thymidylate kinase